jgi:hypothetical protein
MIEMNKLMTKGGCQTYRKRELVAGTKDNWKRGSRRWKNKRWVNCSCAKELYELKIQLSELLHSKYPETITLTLDKICRRLNARYSNIACISNEECESSEDDATSTSVQNANIDSHTSFTFTFAAASKSLPAHGHEMQVQTPPSPESMEETSSHFPTFNSIAGTSPRSRTPNSEFEVQDPFLLNETFDATTSRIFALAEEYVRATTGTWLLRLRPTISCKINKESDIRGRLRQISAIDNGSRCQ